MASPSSLDEFRKRWKTELENRKSKYDINQKIENTFADSKQINPEKSFSPEHKEVLCEDIPSTSATYPSRSDEEMCEECWKKRILSEENKELKSEENLFSIDLLPCEPDPSKGNTYYPFRIVGNLLNSNIRSVSSKGSNISGSTCSECARLRNRLKRKSETDDGRQKRVKVDLKLKDIFVAEKKVGLSTEERFLDTFIADLDEINEIPFFDITVPREVAVKIFQHLDIKDLCTCAQVSKSWQSIAEDELIWCEVCHRLGQDINVSAIERRGWKTIVKENIERKRLLVANWKGRVGQLTQLDHLRGGVLCSVDSFQNTVVAGFTSGEVKLWDLESDDSCVFHPSSSALVLRDGEESGTSENIVEQVCLSDKYVAARYTHGNVDIWSVETGTQPLCTYEPQKRDRVVVHISRSSPTVAVQDGYGVDVLYRESMQDDFVIRNHVNVDKWVHHMKFLDDDHMTPGLLLSSLEVVKFYRCGDSPDDMTEIHNMVDAPIGCIDVKVSPALLAVGQTAYSKIYDIHTGRWVSKLSGPTWHVSVINIADSPVDMAVTAAKDRKIRVYDTRVETPVLTYAGHSQQITCVQMDDWKVVSGAEDGFVCVWDQRMTAKLWEWHSRHPVRHCRFHDNRLVVGNIPVSKHPDVDEFESVMHRRYRGSVQVYDFLSDQSTQGVPDICLSSYDAPDASKYNIGLAMPYDTL